MAEEHGIAAVEGHTYEIKGAALFRETDYERTITGKGESITIFDPKADPRSPAVWENGQDPSVEEITTVPAGCQVSVIAAPVIGATVTFKRG
ncbi:hypothetical protein NUU61_001398 [Penicillium alfredii]|uniref:Uncharacterized protein n=1 Tax=Penicillium alfredii TaxID=1506179 RepID=A0A9W9G4E2_9EURO|nr:uncharacterized protein NUU61_001398 [Penicillium alfredii]KAJ5111768.1 hypothetical protein NUU61_001398 [Penicillium alfredii]